MTQTRDRTRHRIASTLTAATITLALLIPAIPAQAVGTASLVTDEVVDINETISDQGFIHPGVGLSADDLRNAQAHVRAGTEPWASYFAAMSQTTFATSDYRASNSKSAVERDVPLDRTFQQVGMRNRETNDSFGALTQSLMWVMTGNEVYRRNAIQALRTWGNMDPNAYAYFPDAHIHTGHPLYQFLMAAEIIRATEPLVDGTPGTYDGYDVKWTATDDSKLLNNFARPVVDTFLFSNQKWMNQHNFGLFGRIATAIYSDDVAGYAKGVEWFTVNSTYDGYDNGAVAPQVPVIAADDPANPYGYEFIQVREMGRDQAHGETNIDNYTGLARMLEVQGTQLDPQAGTVSVAADAVSAYDFLDRRILAGANQFYRFMLGAWTPWVDERGEGWDGTISQAYRGRLFNPVNELYYEYSVERGVDVETEAPWLADLSARRDGPFFYNGVGLSNFWSPGDKNPEYWVAFPEELAGEAPKPKPADPDIRLADHGLPLDDATELVSENGTSFLRAHVDAQGTASVIHRVMHDRKGVHGLLLRSNGEAVIDVLDKEAANSANSHEVDAKLVASIRVPDTDGQWRFVTIPEYGENVIFLRISGEKGTTVDLDRLRLQADVTLTPPVFAQVDQPLYLTAGQESTFDLSATDTGVAVSYRAAGLPSGSTLDAATGKLAWTPDHPSKGRHEIRVTADDGETVNTRSFELVVSSSRQQTIKTVIADLTEPDAVYTTETREPFDSARNAAEEAARKGSYTEFAEATRELLRTAHALRLLNPRMGDGSLDYRDGVVTPSTLDATGLANLSDGNSGSGTADFRVDSFTLDFGTRYRITPESFGLQARYTFGNRLQGTNVYGSNDAIHWDLLTESPAENKNEPQDIEVVAEHADDAYRYLKLQVDEPGIATDPAYPGLWSFSELRIHGDRSEVAGDIAKVTVSSSQADAGRVVAGDGVSISITAVAPVDGVTASVGGTAVAVSSSDGGTTWAGSVTLGEIVGGGRLDVVVDHTTADGGAAATIHGTTDGTWLYGASESNLVDISRSAVVDPSGAPDAAKAAQAARMLDGDLTTFSEVPAVDGKRFVIWDLGEGSQLSLDRLDFLPRLDNTGMVNVEELVFEGSNDLTAWTPVTKAPRKSLGWQALESIDSGNHRYLRVSALRGISIVELRVFGDLQVQLAPLFARADAVDLSAHTRASAILFSREVEAVRAAAEQPDADSVALGKRLLAAWGLLKAAETASPVVLDPAWVLASTATADGTVDPAGNGWRMFDGAAGTWTDTTTKACTVTVIPSDGRIFDVVGVRYLPRDSAVSRSTGMSIDGSSDGGSTWTPISNTGTPVRGWNTPPLTAAGSYDALRITGGNGYCNVAELQFLVAIIDRSGLSLLLSETGQLDASSWSPESWARLSTARADGQKVVEDPAATQDEVDAAASSLEDATAALTRA